ncbi:hypothetical protein O181_100656 [Austropuccinia psidii MF-1]|uniref:Uncharacterized protein n=1 Tax=Austropuccinia psidii MF-1 TaxID=1389203 RepID=A0A9Q3JFQ7_9BASI|nr:hypothetical protein [Austropuccinia psidii MF-1]
MDTLVISPMPSPTAITCVSGHKIPDFSPNKEINHLKASSFIIFSDPGNRNSKGKQPYDIVSHFNHILAKKEAPDSQAKLEVSRARILTFGDVKSHV